MPQLNVLPLNVSQNIELKDESASFNSTTSNDDFSQYIDLHLTKSRGAESSGKVDGVKSEAKNSKSPIDSKLDRTTSDDLVENIDTNDETDSGSHVQKVAASGKKGQIESNLIDQKALLESEQLMSFLTKADNTLINQSVESRSLMFSPEQLSAEQKAQYEAQLLLNSSNLVTDLSGVAKALSNDQVGVALAPTLTEQEMSAEELLINAAKVTGKDSAIVTLSVESIIDGKNKDGTQTEVALVKSAEKNMALSELKKESKAEAKLTNVSGDKASTIQQAPNQGLSVNTAAESDLVTENNKNTSLTAEQKIAKQVKVEQAQMSNEKTIESSKAGKLSNRQLSENEKINTNTTSQISNKSQEQLDAIKSLENTVKGIEKQATASTQIQNEKLSSLPDSQLTKGIEVTTANEEAVHIKNEEAVHIKKTASANNQQLKSSEHLVNQSTLSKDDAEKMRVLQEGKVQLQTSLTEQSQQKLAVQDEDAVFVEDKVVANVKGEFSANGNFIDVTGKATQTAQHIIEQQSAEILNPSVATEVTQSQKTNAQLHQETISLFRKDFSDAVKDKVMLMISQKLQQFDITLDPPELGNMQVRVNLQGEQAVVNFLVQSQQTKDALEQNMHKLRELLAEQGVDVGDANVEQQSQQSSNEEGSTAKHHSDMENDIGNMANDVVEHTLSAKMIDSSTATVDYYA